MTEDLIVIDGSTGGGQILRSSLSLSMITGRPFRIEKIRAKRKKPGLARQHLTAVRAAADCCGAEVTGVDLLSTELEFRPGTVKSGNYVIRIGTAGSTSLVIQTLLLPLAWKGEGTTALTVEGGTHNSMAPTFDFLDRVYLPVLRQIGVPVQAKLKRHGFMPAGGGLVEVEIDPVGPGDR